MTNENEFKLEQLQSMVNSLKEITTIIVGLALTNAIVQFLVEGTAVREITEISLESAVIFVLLIVNMIRFYHGNFRHLDVTYSTTNFQSSISGSIKQHPKGEKVTIDFFFILVESLMLCAMSFYQARPLYYFYSFIALLTVDVFWFFATYHLVPDKETFRHQKIWSMNNFGAIIILLILLQFSTSSWQWALNYACAVVLFVNTIIDYGVLWNFYFPFHYVSEKRDGEE